MSTESSGAAPSAAALERIYHKHTRATRVLHWTNVIIIGALLWTALLLLSGTPELPYSHWLPPGFYAGLHLDNRNDEGRVWHVLFSFLMIAVGVAYTAYLAISGRWKTFLPNATSWDDAYRVVLSDLGIRRNTPSQQKYNGAQRIAYTGVVILGLGESSPASRSTSKTGRASRTSSAARMRSARNTSHSCSASSPSSSCISCKSRAPG